MSDQMTDNEKAATFIGWVGACDEHPWSGDVRCSKAPDMSKPENYMRALDRLHQRGAGFVQWGNGCFATFNDEDGTDHTGPIKETIAEAVVAFLVALYDAEHES